jgi:exopolysaccharide biosynthesis polyprenyl glycosylphosphotransferase
VVEATLEERRHARRLAWVSGRTQLGWASIVADAVAVTGAYLVAIAASTFALSAIGRTPAPAAPDWPIVVLFAVAVCVFFVSGLYELEAYVSRPLHLWMLLKSSAISFGLSTLVLYSIRPGVFGESRVVLLVAFGVFVLFAFVLRLGILDALCGVWLWQRRPVSLLVGESETMRRLGKRLESLRAFNKVERIEPEALRLGPAEALRTALVGRQRTEGRAASVFVDASSMKPREAYNAAAIAQSLGAEVYVLSGLLVPLEGNRLLSKLFEAPAIRLRRTINGAKPYPVKRVLDIVGSAALLVVCAPVIAVLAVLIRLTSPGPVFYRQTRLGRLGTPFEFLKLRSMVVNGDECIHADYVRAFMNGTAEAVAVAPGGEAVFKRVDDPRITPVGRFIRKYSLDEIPQFWNVLRGDMSLVGPRPSLPYEADEYDDWGSLRLAAPAGITGLWQVTGRSRVTFEEMVFQDVMYAQSMRLWVDIGLCLRTLPATLLGGGGG